MSVSNRSKNKPVQKTTINKLLKKYGSGLKIDFVDNYIPNDNHRLYYVEYNGDVILNWSRVNLNTIDNILAKTNIPVIASKRVLVKYTQVFWGQTLHDSYETYIDEHHTESDIFMGLYSDPHVVHVEIIPL